MTYSTPTLIVVAGPTAIGKTALSIKLAAHFNTEIISADSRQFYREMRIGTAVPSEEELATVPHHFIHSHSVHNSFTVGDFEKESLSLLNTLFDAHSTVVMTGGSGLFVKAVVSGFDELPQAPEAVRASLNALYQQQGIVPLQQQLQQADPLYYQEVDLQNPQRIIRALEVYNSTGIPFSSYRNKARKDRGFRIIQIGLNQDRETLYQRINARVDAMIRAGLVEEVRSLLPYRHLNALNTVGYSEIFEYLDGNVTLDEAIAAIKQNTRRFAKRQLTWFKKDENIKWFEPDQFDAILQYIEQEQQSS